jgi:hypothetical protein
MIFESLRRLIIAVVYIIGFICSFFVSIGGIMALVQTGNIGASVFLIISGIVLFFLTFVAAKLVNWIFQY